MIHRLLSALFLLTVCVAVASAAELVTLTGKKINGTVISVDSQSVEFKDDSGITTKVPAKEIAIVELGSKIAPAPAKFDEIELTDGSMLRVTSLKVKGKKLEVSIGDSVKLDIPLNTVYSILRDADDAAKRADWVKLLANRGKRDLFVVRQAEGLNPLPGTVLEGNEEGDRLSFEREDGQKVNLPLTRATGGIVFNQAARDTVLPTICKVYDATGNVWYATAITVSPAGLIVKTVAGATIEFASNAGVSKLDFGQGNIQYLSALDPVAAYPPPEKDGALGEQFPFQLVYQKDRALDAPEIVLDGKKYSRGISVPPDTTLTYKLDGSYREFKALIGIHDAVRPDDGSLKIKIEIDGRAVFAESISKKNKPKDVVLNVKDARELKITVEREGLFAGNQVNLAEARVQK